MTLVEGVERLGGVPVWQLGAVRVDPVNSRMVSQRIGRIDHF